MCYLCWKDRYKGARIINDKTQAASILIKKVFEVGGNLHLIIDDWNLEDSLFESEKKELTDNEAACFKLLSEMSVAERASALALASGYLKP